MGASAGSFAWAGFNANLTVARNFTLGANRGIFSMAGQNANLSRQTRLLTASSGSYAMTGNQASFAGGGITQFALGYDRQTPEQISIYCPITGSVGTTGKVFPEYKVSGSGTWIAGRQLSRINPAYVEVEAGDPVTAVDAFAGVIFDLSPGTTYDVRLTLTETGQPNKTLTGTRATRSLPATAGTPNKTLTTAGNLQTTLNGLNPGDVLQLANGTYTVSGLVLARSGTSGSPIYIRGASRSGVVIKDTTGVVLEIDECSNVVIENLTIEGSSVDSGQSASSIGVQFWSGRTSAQTNITFRNVTFRGVDQGIEAAAEMNDCLVYNCTLTGNNLWNSTFLASNGVNTWNDDGICMPGLGNCAWNNTISGFGDAFSVKQLTYSAAVFFWRNLVPFTGDDTFEADHAVRNIGFYDNYITNCGTLLSLDPLYGGPLYCFRNICINSFRGPYKWNVGAVSRMSGWNVENNTVVRTDGTTGVGWYQPPNGDLRNWSYRNNLLIYRGAGPAYIMDPPNIDPLDFTNNGWFSPTDVRFRWNSSYYANLATARTSLPATTPVFGTSTQRHNADQFTVSNPFTATITLGADHTTQFVGTPSVALAVGSSLKNAGVAIPGITDGFTGAAPDIGASITGRAAVNYGDSLPAWITANAASVGVVYEIPNTSIRSVDPNPPTNRPAGGTVSQKLDAWCSVAADEENAIIYACAGGGHTDYDGNEVDRLQLNVPTPAWEERRPPTIPTTANVTHYSDGRPTARHHYYGLHHDPTRNQLILTGGASYGAGTPLNKVDAFDIATNDYLAANTIVSLPGSQGVGLLAEENRFTGLDRRNGNIYTNGNNILVKIDRAANTMTTLRNGNSPMQGTQTGGAWDSTRNLFFFPTVERTYAPDTDTFATATMTGAAAASIRAIGQYGVFYYAPLDAFFVLPGGGGTIYKIDAGSKACTVLTTTGATIPAAAANLMFYKFHALPTLKGAVAIPSANANAFYVRLEA